MTGTLADRALRFVEIVTATARAAKLPGFQAEAWDALTPLIAPDDFLYVGRAKEERTLGDMVAAMDRWARETEFSSELRRLEESGPLVFMERDESSRAKGETARLNTLTVFEFDPAGRLRRIDAFQ